MGDAEGIDRASRAEALLARLDELPAGEARELATEAVGSVVELYGDALRRIVEGLDDALTAALCEDDLVAHLLMVHDLHPSSTEERIDAALATVRPYLGSHGGGVELLGVEGGTARLRLNGTCSGCPASATTLKLAVEDAIRKHAPEVETIEAEEADAPAGDAHLLQIENVRPNGAGSAGGPRAGATKGGGGNGGDPLDAGAGWTVVGSLPELRGGGTVVREIGDDRLLFAAVDDDRYAYRPLCPGCGESLAGADLAGGELRCKGCGRVYDLRRAGRCLDSPQLQLEPVPLLIGEGGMARVATGEPA